MGEGIQYILTCHDLFLESSRHATSSGSQSPRRERRPQRGLETELDHFMICLMFLVLKPMVTMGYPHFRTPPFLHVYIYIQLYIYTYMNAYIHTISTCK